MRWTCILSVRSLKGTLLTAATVYPGLQLHAQGVQAAEQAVTPFVFILSQEEAADLYAPNEGVDLRRLSVFYGRLAYYRSFLNRFSPGPDSAALLPYGEVKADRLFVSAWIEDGEEIDQLLAEALASMSKVIGQKINRQGLCLKGVAMTLSTVIQHETNFYKLPVDLAQSRDSKTYKAGKSADDFLKWADENPIALCNSFRMRASQELRTGYIAVYRKGRCGFSANFGHIEVISDANTGCSDHCRRLKNTCLPDLVLAPIKSCESVHYDTVLTATDPRGGWEI